MSRELFRAAIIDWQRWRNALWERYGDEKRHLAGNRRHAENQFAYHAGNPERQLSDVGLLSDEQGYFDGIASVYNAAVDLDTRIKTAWNGGRCNLNGVKYNYSNQDLPALLQEASQFMADNQHLIN